ncbi:MAG: leucyl/phenylalanyl-tRNA--protein transferase [Actinomycetota bacterium]
MNRRSRPSRPQQPIPTKWRFPPIDELPTDDDLAAVGADLEPGTILAAYSAGFFPMPVSRREIGWFHPDPRGIIPLDGLRVSRSLRRSVRRFATTVDHDFEAVLDACADPARPMGWIDQRIRRAYTRLHHMGWAHSIEVWDDDGLAGGLYGLAIGGLFAGESMFHRRTDASKVALVSLVERLGDRPDALLDVQWVTPHLASLGAVPIDRRRYAERLARALALPLPVGMTQSTAFAPSPVDGSH